MGNSVWKHERHVHVHVYVNINDVHVHVHVHVYVNVHVSVNKICFDLTLLRSVLTCPVNVHVLATDPSVLE